jgi:hypothetical protein
MLLKKFKDNPGLSKNLTNSHVVLDPDLIDLTLIPPPMTPDEVRPFCRMILDPDLIDLTLKIPPMTPD